MQPPRFETARLILTWPTPAQIDGYYRDIVGTDIFDTILWDGPDSEQDLHDYWGAVRAEDWAAPGAALALALIEPGSGRYIGGAALRPRAGRVWDVGYALAPQWHGQGYATETVRELVRLGFSLRSADEIIAEIFLGNVASRRVAEKAGMTLDATLPQSVRKRGVWLDQWRMRIRREEYGAR